MTGRDPPSKIGEGKKKTNKTLISLINWPASLDYFFFLGCPTVKSFSSQGLGRHFCEDTWAARWRPRHVPAQGWCHPPAAGPAGTAGLHPPVLILSSHPCASGDVITHIGVGWCMSYNICPLYISARQLIGTMSRRTSHQFNPTTLL